MIPRPPALDTAAASSAKPTKCMPPWMIGCSMPNSSVMRVFMGVVLGWGSSGLDWTLSYARDRVFGNSMIVHILWREQVCAAQILRIARHDPVVETGVFGH